MKLRVKNDMKLLEQKHEEKKGIVDELKRQLEEARNASGRSSGLRIG